MAAYIESLKLLDGFRTDVQRVIEEACRANLEFRQDAGETHIEARDVVLKDELDEMIAEASSDWLPFKNIAGAALLSQPMEIYRQKFDASLSEEVAKFSKQFFESLARLVDRELCGLVQWLPNNCCRYHLFRRVVIQGAMKHTSPEAESLSQRVSWLETALKNDSGIAERTSVSKSERAVQKVKATSLAADAATATCSLRTCT